MHLTPDDLAAAGFTVVRKGYDPDEVHAFLEAAARTLDDAQQHAVAMEQRVRAATARLHDAEAASTGGSVTHGLDHTPSQPALTTSTVAIRTDDAETISRTLLLAQRTADQLLAAATEEAAALRASAGSDAEALRSSSHAEAQRLVTEARAEARRVGESERVKVMSEIQALLAHLDFLREDVKELEAYAAAQRQRLFEAADAMRTVAEGSVGRVADMRHPVLSPAADLPRVRPTGSVTNEVLSPVSKAAPVTSGEPVTIAGSTPSRAGTVVGAAGPLELSYDAPTAAMPAVPSAGPTRVPENDDWDPSVRLRIVKPNQSAPIDHD